MVSYIQSVYWEFGSGVVLEDSGVIWQNRGSSFSLDPRSHVALAPGRKPFHTLNPALDVLNASGTVLASNDNGAPDGRNSQLTFTAPSAGNYIIKVSATASTFPAAPGCSASSAGTRPARMRLRA